jgi:hypothetical protein
VILTGPSGAGKTTTSLECVRRGFRYVTDEYTALNPAGVTVYPFPRAATLKCRNPHLPDGECYELELKGHYRGFFTPEQTVNLEDISLPSPQIIFLERRSDGPPRARRLTNQEILKGLICATFDFFGREAQAWPAISAMAVRSKACELRYSDSRRDLDVALEVLDTP